MDDTIKESMAAGKKKVLEEVEKFFSQQVEYADADPASYKEVTPDDWLLWFIESF